MTTPSSAPRYSPRIPSTFRQKMKLLPHIMALALVACSSHEPSPSRTFTRIEVLPAYSREGSKTHATEDRRVVDEIASMIPFEDPTRMDYDPDYNDQYILRFYSGNGVSKVAIIRFNYSAWSTPEKYGPFKIVGDLKPLIESIIDAKNNNVNMVEPDGTGQPMQPARKSEKPLNH